MFKRILVLLDGSPRAERALPVAARIARAYGGSILLLQVVSPPIDYGGGLAAGGLVTGEMIESEIAVATSYLKTIATAEMLVGSATITEVLYGPPAQGILAYTEAQEADLIIMCNHDRTGITRWAMGSVAHRLVHQSPVPVLVLRDTGDILTRSKAMLPFRVFVPLDGSQLAETALVPAAHLAAALAAPKRGTLHLAQVAKLSTIAVAGSFVGQFNESALEFDRAYLTKVADRLQTTMKDLKLSISWSIASETNDEDVAATLRDMAEHGERGKQIEGEGDGDLIAISTHGRGGLERWVMGSVTERLLNNTKLPMLIVPPQRVKLQP